MSRSEWLLEVAEVLAEVGAVHDVSRVVDDHLTAHIGGKPPVDDALAERAVDRLDVSMTVSEGIASTTAVVHVYGVTGELNLCLITIEPGHFILFL